MLKDSCLFKKFSPVCSRILICSGSHFLKKQGFLEQTGKDFLNKQGFPEQTENVFFTTRNRLPNKSSVAHSLFHAMDPKNHASHWTCCHSKNTTSEFLPTCLPFMVHSFPYIGYNNVCCCTVYTCQEKKPLAFSFANFETTRGSTGKVNISFLSLVSYAPQGKCTTT